MYKMVRGTTQNIVIVIVNDDGTIYKLQAADKLIFGVKGNIESTEYDIRKVLTADNAVNDGYLLSLKPEDTINMTFSRYYFDVGLQTANGDFYMVIECDEFIIAQAVTAKEVST